MINTKKFKGRSKSRKRETDTHSDSPGIGDMTCHSLKRPCGQPFFLLLCSLTIRDNCVYQVSTIILGKLLAAMDYGFMLNLDSLRRVKNKSWNSSYFEGTWEKKSSPTPSAVMVQTLAELAVALCRQQPCR